MADSGSENIGNIDVSIGADYSPLQAAFSAATDAAQQAGADIADALVSGASSAGDVASELTDQLDAIGPAADGAAHGLDDLGDSAGHAAEGAGEAESGLAAMAEQLAAVGEALVITEGLRELGSEALGAADSITRASLALTTITGSGDTAKETIEGLEQLGMSDGLSMPSLLSAATRMQAILGPSADVVGELTTVANGAAVMGTDIETAATKFDQMATAGTASARTLTSLGISLAGLATAFNQVIPGSDATASSVAAMFKALDQSQRVDVLNQALAGLGGTAQQVAEQTFGGQWQQLANAWEGIMVQVGQAILPVISDLLEFTKTDIVPFIQGAIGAFTSLPGPVKDVVVAVGLLAAAVIPVTGGLAAIGLAISGLNGLLPAVTGLMAAFGGEAETVASAEHAEAAATAEMGIAAAAAAPEVEGLAVAQEQLSLSFVATEGAAGLVGEQLSLELVPALEAGATGLAAFTTDVGAMGLGLMAIGPVAALAILSVASLKDGWNQAKDTFSNVTGTIGQLPGVMTSVSNAGGILGTVAGDLKSAWSAVLSVFEQYNTYSLAAKAINEVVDAIDLLVGVTPGATTMTAAFTSEIEKLQKSGTQSAAATDALAASFKAAALAAADGGNALTPLQQSIGNIVVATDKATVAYQLAKQTYDALTSSVATGTPIYNGSVASTEQIATALKLMNDAASAAGISLPPVAGSMDAITAAATTMATASGFVVSAQQEQANETAVAKSSLDLATVSYDTSVAKLDLLKAQLDDANAAYAAGIAPRSAVIAAEQNLQGAYAASQKAEQALNTTADGYAQTMSANVVAGDKAALAGLQDLAAGIGPAAAGMLGLDGVITALQNHMPNFGVIMTTMSTGPMAGLQSALNEASAKVADLNQQMQAGANVGQQYEKAQTAQLNAQIALDQAIAVLNTGLQGATDAYSLARVAVAAAQAKVDDLTTAYQAGLATYAQVQSAQKALTSAQAELTAAQNAGTPAANSLTTANQGLASSAPAAAAGLNAIATAASNAATQVGNVTSMVDGLDAALEQGIQVSANTSGIMYTQWGGVTTAQGLAAMLDASSYLYNADAPPTLSSAQVSANTAAQTAAEKAAYDKGYTPAAIAKAEGQPIATVIADLGLTAGQANMTQSQASGGTNSGLVLDPNQPGSSLPLPGGGSTTTSTTTSSSSSTAPITTASGAGSAAIDGGSYPAVTAHQATGEVWAVDTSGTSSSGGAAASSSVITTTVAQTINQTSGGGASSQLISTIGGAVQQIATNGSGLLAAATATQNLADAVNGLVARTYAGTTPGVTTVATGSTTAAPPVSTASSGVETVTVGGGNPQGPTGPTSSPAAPSVPGYNPFGPGSVGSGAQVNVTVDARGAIGISGASLQSQITQAVTTQLVSQLYAAGARIGR